MVNQTRDGAYAVPQQGSIGGVMNVGFNDCGIGTKLLAVLQVEFHGCLHYGSIDGLQRGRGKPVEGAVESIVHGYGVTVELRKTAQSKPVVDALAQFAVVPVLDA